MKNILFAAIIIALCSCGGHSHKQETEAHAHPVLNATIYSPSVELYVQYDELKAGHTASVTAYVTALPSFKPYEGGAINVALKAGGNNISLAVEPQHKGIYSFNISPSHAAVGDMVFTIDGEQYPVHVHIEGEHKHSHEGHEHHAHNHAGHTHAHDAHSHENNISFSKEHSWKIDFTTAIIKKSSFGGAVKVAAQVASTPDNFTTLVAPAAGKVQFAGNVVAGKAVKQGEPLFYLEGGNVTDNDAAVKFATAESNYTVARNDFERKEALYKDNIVSKRDYEAAAAAYAQASAVYESMKRSFSSGRACVKSTIAGYVSYMLVQNGDYVQAGAPLAVIQRDGDMNISAELPVRYASLLGNLSAINVELSDGRLFSSEQLFARIAAVGSAVNSCSMLPVTITTKPIEGVVPGSIVTLHLSATAPAGVDYPVVPRSAIVEEMGNYFVFVQHTPVSFEKREVKIGATDGIMVQLLAGAHEGERVVTKGGVSLKLSQGAAALDPHAGHVH